MKRQGNYHRGPARTLSARSRTGILGIGIAEVMVNGRRLTHYVANCGRRSKKFNIVRLGRAEALRRALKVRSDYELAAKGVQS